MLFGKNSLNEATLVEYHYISTSLNCPQSGQTEFIVFVKNAVRGLISLSFHLLQQDYGKNVKLKKGKSGLPTSVVD